MGIPHNNTDTSMAAANRKAASVDIDRSRIVDHLNDAGAYGCTYDEIECSVGMLHQTASARLNDLQKFGSVIDSGKRRKTRTAVVHGYTYYTIKRISCNGAQYEEHSRVCCCRVEDSLL